MPSIAKRWIFSFLGAVFILYNLSSYHSSFSTSSFSHVSSSVAKWRQAQNTRWPLTKYVGLPKGPPAKLPKIQAASKQEPDGIKQERLKRLQAVKDTMKHSWKGYKANAWLKDEVTPLSGSFADKFGGWAATLVDSLDTLWIMDMKAEFYEAVLAVSKIDFGSSVQSSINVFETTIRYLGGFLAAYDLSGERILLEKAVELGEMLYVAFDTPNRMPIPRWNWYGGLSGLPQEAPGSAVVAEIASLCIEFTRLSQLTGDNRFYDAIDRITRLLDEQQDKTFLPGLWPYAVNVQTGDLASGTDFSIGAMADSTFEYLPKMHMLLGGRDPVYQKMYEKSLAAMHKHIFFRALNPEDWNIMFPGDARVGGYLHEGDKHRESVLNPSVQHLGCYAGGMVGIGARLFGQEEEEVTARALTDGCIWAYESSAHGIMPEIFHAVPCDKEKNPKCNWDEELWLSEAMKEGSPTEEEREGGTEGGRHFANRMRLTPGIVSGRDRRYLLRPEAIESVFIMYRITADRRLQDHGWNMFSAVVNATRTDVAHAALHDVMQEEITQEDNMESFWTAETLKYYYLLFSDPEVISLDEYVLNTEAHPLKRPAAK